MKCIVWQGRTCQLDICDACVTCPYNPNRDRVLPYLQDILAKRIRKVYGEEYVEIAYAQISRKTVIAMYFHTFPLFHSIILALRNL